MTDTQVLVVGAGPTGLMLAGELALRGVSCRMLEQRAEESNLTRAFGVHARTLEQLDMRGLADTLVRQGIQIGEIRPAFGGSSVRLPMRHPESRFPFVLIVPQARTEALLTRHVEDLGVPVERGSTVIDVQDDDRGVIVTIEGRDGVRTERADYVIGCDGAHSRVRYSLGVGFSGSTYDTSILLADLRLADADPTAVRTYLGRDGVVLMPPFGDGWVRAVIWDRRRQHVPLLSEYMPMDCGLAESTNCNYETLENGFLFTVALVVTGLFTLTQVIVIDVALPLWHGRRPATWLGAAVLIPAPFLVCLALASLA